MNRRVLPVAALLIACCCGAAQAAKPQFKFNKKTRTQTFDRVWRHLDREYPYFAIHDVDWDAVRNRHRDRAIQATRHSEFVRELGRMLCWLRDPHVTLSPPGRDLQARDERWSIPDLGWFQLRQRLFILDWPAGYTPNGPERDSST